ncbi:RdgB/HAM1 family non-canonical purine NTP pyrophosphatase [Methanomassiliicoccaceae archaeon COG_1]|nr:RdgB/HAM1 family non-canonical purine NTP pyrophosphatase [Methanomassiliicoccaceae archaeon COG_1]
MRVNIVTHNPGKVMEYQLALGQLGIEAMHDDRECDEVQTAYLEEVVDKEMKQLHSEGLRDFLVDDSGLFVNALKGFPGVYSAYGQKTIGNKGILKLMEGVGDRSAVFRCCIGCWIGNERIVVLGECPGEILSEERGDGGFGYDPIFSPDGERSFAEIPVEDKNAISHRGRAISMLADELAARKLV